MCICSINVQQHCKAGDGAEIRDTYRNDRLGVLLLLLLYQEVMQNLDHVKISIHKSDHFVSLIIVVVPHCGIVRYMRREFRMRGGVYDRSAGCRGTSPMNDF
jgi:hypothetical protein